MLEGTRTASTLSSQAAVAEEVPATARFTDILADPGVQARWERVRRWFFLRESTYDMTRRCNIQCEGCYYYEGEKQRVVDQTDPAAWRELMRAEKARGITYVVLAGAEPSLVPELLQVCHQEMPLGAIATNGVRRIPETVRYRIHISVWGDDRTSQKLRGAKELLGRQIQNYRGDERAIFVYTFTRDNVEQSFPVVERLVSHGCPVTFNVFSAPVGYLGPCRHDRDSLDRTRGAMLDLLDRFPEAVLFSSYNAVAHTQALGLDALYGCSYPRANPSTALGLGRSFRQYRSDLSHNRAVACCVPDTECADCRHYAAGSAVVTARLNRHADDPLRFRAWLDYVDTYLAVWVLGYEKSPNLCHGLVSPPGDRRA
jgi:MoaA/NifB/PqqE/SkfB family radical SAM enzyme